MKLLLGLGHIISVHKNIKDRTEEGLENEPFRQEGDNSEPSKTKPTYP